MTQVRRVLLADSDKRTLRLLQASLEKHAYHVVTARNGNEAYELIVSDPPDLVIADVKLPKIGGFELLKKTREIEELKEISWLFLTANSSMEDKIRSLELGADDYLTKPILLREFMGKLDILFARKASHLLSSYRTSHGQNVFSGSSKQLGVIDLLQIIDQMRRSGTLSLTSTVDSSKTLVLSFREGMILHVSQSQSPQSSQELSSAEEALLSSALSLQNFDFKLEFGPILDTQETLKRSISSLILEVLHTSSEEASAAPQEKSSSKTSIASPSPPLSIRHDVRDSELIPSSKISPLQTLPSPASEIRDSSTQTEAALSSTASPLKQVHQDSKLEAEIIQEKTQTQTNIFSPLSSENSPTEEGDLSYASDMENAFVRSSLPPEPFSQKSISLIPPNKPLTSSAKFVLVFLSLLACVLVLLIAARKSIRGRYDTRQGLEEQPTASLSAPLVSQYNEAAAPAHSATTDPTPSSSAPSSVPQALPNPNLLDASPAVANSAPTDTPVPSKKELQKAMDMGKLKEVIRLGALYTEAHPEDGEAWLLLGAAYQEKNDIPNAQNAFRNCVEKGKGPRVSECRMFLRR